MAPTKKQTEQKKKKVSVRVDVDEEMSKEIDEAAAALTIQEQRPVDRATFVRETLAERLRALRPLINSMRSARPK